MKDILGRELKDGDLCIGMAIGRNSSGMHIGVFHGSSVVYLGYKEQSIHKSCTSNTYLIENPTEKELEIKEKVQKFLDKEEDEKRKKAALKTIPLGKMEVGGIYKTKNEQIYLYLGKRKLIFEDISKNKKLEEKEGHCFAYGFFIDDAEVKEKTTIELLEIFLAINVGIYNIDHHIDVLKGNKKFTEMIRKIDLVFPLIKTQKGSSYYFDKNKEVKLIIE